VSGRYLAYRAASLVITFFIIITASFFLMRFAPGSPFTSEKAISDTTLRYEMARYGYDRPLIVQYVLYLGRVLRGDLGPSLSYRGRSVAGIIGEALPYSFALGALALVFAYTAGVLVGLVCAVGRETWMDVAVLGVTLAGICLPSFLLAKLALFFFGYTLKIAPTAGYNGPASLVLPAAVLALPYVAYVARLGRKSFGDEYLKDYVRTARSMGIPELRILYAHVLKNGFLPLLTFMGPAAAALLTGSVVIEKVFALPGLGTYFVYGALNRDHFLVMGVVILYSLLLLCFNFAVDVLYRVVDPRIGSEV